MTDERARELQRQAAQGDAQAQGKLLRMRVRAGEISEDQLRAAAYLGAEAARAALAEGAPSLPPGAVTWMWIRGLSQWGGEEALFRAAVAGSSRARDVWERANPGDTRYARALDACRACTGDTSAAAAEDAAALARELPWASPLSYPPNRAARALRAVGEWLGNQQGTEKLLDSLQHSYHSVSPEALRDAIRSELLPWCLPEAES